MKMNAKSIASMLLVTLFCSLPASARPFVGPMHNAATADDPPEGFQPRLSASTGLLCVKQCPNDDLPCDPPSYKRADGRCTTQWN